MPEEKGDHPKRGAPPVARRYFTSSTLAPCHGHIGVGAPSSPNGPLLPWGEGQAPCSNRADQKALKFPEITQIPRNAPQGRLPQQAHPAWRPCSRGEHRSSTVWWWPGLQALLTPRCKASTFFSTASWSLFGSQQKPRFQRCNWLCRREGTGLHKIFYRTIQSDLCILLFSLGGLLPGIMF